MPIIEREDGIHFAVYTYRELILSKRASLLRQEFALLQKENGNYARFFEQETGDIEVVFAQEQSYLLAETIWFYFDQPNNFIFCEALPDDENAILVVARGGSIFLDSKVPVSGLIDEFISLAGSENAYEIFISGDSIPLAQKSSDEKYAFPPDLVKSFTELDTPVFPLLEPDKDLALLPVNEAFKELSVAKSKMPQIIIGAVIFGLVFFGLYDIFKPAEKVEVPVSIFKPPPRDPYAAYKAALATPAPDQLIAAMTDAIAKVSTVPGWQISQLNYSKQTLITTLQSIGGTTHMLVDWVELTHVVMHGEGNNATVMVTTKVPNRSPPKKIYQARFLVADVFDALNRVLPPGSVTIGDYDTYKNYVASSMSVTFSEITPNVLNLVGKQLANLPINLGAIDATIRGGLLTGSFDMQILGYSRNTDNSEDLGESSS